MSSFQPDPKPRKRIIDAGASREALQRDGGRCVICGSRCFVGAHHIVPRSQGGDDVLQNLVALCDDHHGGIHRATGPARSELRLVLTADQVAYVKTRKGGAWLGDRYPLPS